MAKPRSGAVRFGGILLVIALVLVVAGCSDAASGTHAQIASPTARSTMTSPPTATPSLTVIKTSGPPTAGKAAVWRRANLPAGFGLQLAGSDLEVAQSDGTTAYSCAPLVGQVSPIVVTHDAGLSWQRAAALPDAAHLLCTSLAVDMLNPATVVAQSHAPDATGVVSFDGGHNWHTLPKAAGYIFKLATRNGRTVALLEQPTSAALMLEESDDQMHTWQRIDSNLSGGDIESFVMNPATGSIAVIAERGLFVTDDDGAHWTMLQHPVARINEYMLPQPAGTGPWHACASYFSDAGGTKTALACTLDGGNAWQQLPDLAGYTQVVGIPPPMAPYWPHHRSVAVILAGSTAWRGTPHAGKNLGRLRHMAHGPSLCRVVAATCSGSCLPRATAAPSPISQTTCTARPTRVEATPDS